MKKIIFTLSIGLAMFWTPSRAQVIPNASFETWSRDTIEFFSQVIFDHPNDWYPLASLFNAMFGGGEIGLYQSSDHHGAGSSSALMEISTNSMGADIFTAFPVSQLPTSLTGYYKYEGTVPEPAMVSVVFTRYDPVADSGVLIAEGGASLSNIVTSFSPFTVDIQAVGTGAPDTCYILITYLYDSEKNAPVKTTSKFWVDNLSFQGTAGIVRNTLPEVILLQDQASSWVALEWRHEPGKEYAVEVYSLAGRLIERQEKVEGRATFNTANLPKGLYIIRLTDGQRTLAKKFVR